MRLHVTIGIAAVMHHVHLTLARRVHADLLFAGRRHGALLALRRSRVDFSAADAVFARHPLRCKQEAAMSEPMIKTRTYVIVCALLVLLTFLTVGISFFPIEGRWHLILGLLIALAKATLVVLFFMHVLISPRVTWIVIVVSCFWLLILMALTFTDYATRGMIPFMPGH